MDPSTRTIRILNLGAGVQSSALALMIARGDLPPIDAAIFADTQEESAATYSHLDWLIAETKAAFPTLVRSFGKLGDGLVIGRTHRKGFSTIPAFTLGKNGSRGMLRRACTGDYKIDVIDRTIRREVLGLKPRQRWPKNVACVQIMGLSLDELPRSIRVTKAFDNAPGRHSSPEYPLIDLGMTRTDCARWLQDYPVPHPVPRSACVFCPYKSNREWRRLRDEDPEGWSRAVEMDAALRSAHRAKSYMFKNPCFVHADRKPLEQVDLGDGHQDQGEFGFSSDCEGGCGL